MFGLRIRKGEDSKNWNKFVGTRELIRDYRDWYTERKRAGDIFLDQADVEIPKILDRMEKDLDQLEMWGVHTGIGEVESNLRSYPKRVEVEYSEKELSLKVDGSTTVYGSRENFEYTEDIAKEEVDRILQMRFGQSVDLSNTKFSFKNRR